MQFSTFRSSSALVSLRARLVVVAGQQKKNNVVSRYYVTAKTKSRLYPKLNFVDARFLSTTSSNVFKPWKTHMVESMGDYRQEAFLEDHIGGPLYEHQKNLPRLPIPNIADTLERFLPTALPLAKSHDETNALLKACEAFPQQAQVLQERLMDRRDKEMKDSSWLMLWWNQVGASIMLQSVWCRGPVCAHCVCFLNL